jgi:hypothetical protein
MQALGDTIAFTQLPARFQALSIFAYEYTAPSRSWA